MIMIATAQPAGQQDIRTCRGKVITSLAWKNLKNPGFTAMDMKAEYLLLIDVDGPIYRNRLNVPILLCSLHYDIVKIQHIYFNYIKIVHSSFQILDQ
jgi:hypothetical protein